MVKPLKRINVGSVSEPSFYMPDCAGSVLMRDFREAAITREKCFL